RKFSKRLSELESFGDEIGWHVHLWRWNDAVGGWYAEVDDRPWIEKCIRKGYSAIPERWRPTSVKSGWGFQTYRTLALLGELGLKVDLSCIPDAHNISYTKQGLKVDVQDWRGSPTLPYLPHKKDHKKAGGEEALSIWEVPNATFRYKNLNVAGRFVRNMIPYRGGKLVSPRIVVKKRGSAAAGGSIELFRRACDEVFSSAGKGGISVFSIYFHPDCLLVDSSSGLYENRDNLAANLECIGTVSKRTGVPFRFLTGKELVAKLGATE
ncbi:MAG: hypothetical protein KAT70_04740, partial [Thermoplasmata archaeon]|nr:hypothetical protein [Thermoplasmata archaeon]